MAAGRTLRSLVSRRRPADDEGEDEDGPVFVDDSQSEGSVLTEGYDEEDVDVEAGSVAGQGDAQAGSAMPPPVDSETTTVGTAPKQVKKATKKSSKKAEDLADAADAQPVTEFKAMVDTQAMMNGLSIAQRNPAGESVADFETMDQPSNSGAARVNGEAMSVAERQRREHEEYRKKRDSNPAFIPNRGNFFMHDTRGQSNGPGPVNGNVWQNRFRGRGAGVPTGPAAAANQSFLADRGKDQLWKHDLHDTINEEPVASTAPPAAPAVRAPSMQHPSSHLFPKAPPTLDNTQHRSISFDSTVLIGKVQARVSLPGMASPSTTLEVPVRKYVRLPHHRPPLRRDKAVRVHLPGHSFKQCFPSIARSFIFIPRQMRPNQPGFNRGYQRSMGGYGYSSRRTSMHGSMYSASVAPSRRSSIAGASRDRGFSPAGSFNGMAPSRPVVRLPYGSQHSTPIATLSGHHTPIGQLHTYPLPQVPFQLGTPTTTVHQPRPQKAVDITSIEAQPFQQQLPAHLNEQPQYAAQAPPQPYFSPGPQYQYPIPHPQNGTPMSGIPEQAIHAAAFQPPAYGQPHYYPHYPQQSYMYSPPESGGYPPMPMYMMQPPPSGYMQPPGGPTEQSMPPPPAAPARPPSTADNAQSQSGMVAHESNGMVFYVPASEAQSSEQQYQPAEGFVPSYAMPGLPPPTPAPDNSMQYYYPPMPPQGMQEMNPGVYYPSQ